MTSSEYNAISDRNVDSSNFEDVLTKKEPSKFNKHPIRTRPRIRGDGR